MLHYVEQLSMSLELGEFISADVGYGNEYHTPGISLRFAVIRYHQFYATLVDQAPSFELAEESSHRLCGGFHPRGDNASVIPLYQGTPRTAREGQVRTHHLRYGTLHRNVQSHAPDSGRVQPGLDEGVPEELATEPATSE